MQPTIRCRKQYRFYAEGNPCPRDSNKNPIYLSYNITNTITSPSNGQQQHTLANISIHEISTGQVIKYATFYIAINDTEHTTNTKAIWQYSSWIMKGFFEAPNGTLVLDLVHSNSSSNNNSSGVGGDNHHSSSSINHIQINAKGNDPFTNAWLPMDNNNTITVTNMPLQANKTYLMHIEVFTLDSPKNIFTSNQAPKVDLVFNASNGSSSSEAVANNSIGRILLVPEFGSITSLAIMAGALGIMFFMAAARTDTLQFRKP